MNMPTSTKEVGLDTDRSSDKSEKDVAVVYDVVKLSPAEHTRLLHKLDWHLLPLVSLLYLLSFL